MECTLSIVILILNEETVVGTGILLNQTTDYISSRAVVRH